MSAPKPRLIDSGTGETRQISRRDRSIVPGEHDDPRGLPWATFQFKRYAVLVRLARIGGVLEIASVEVRGFDSPNDDAMVPVRSVRLPITEMLRLAKKQLAEPYESFDGVWFGQLPADDQPAKAGRPREYDYQEAARIYAEASIQAKDPKLALARAYGMKRRSDGGPDKRSAAKLIDRLIQSGVLEPGGNWRTTVLAPTAKAKGSASAPKVRARKGTKR